MDKINLAAQPQKREGRNDFCVSWGVWTPTSFAETASEWGGITAGEEDPCRRTGAEPDTCKETQCLSQNHGSWSCCALSSLCLVLIYQGREAHVNDEHMLCTALRFYCACYRIRRSVSLLNSDLHVRLQALFPSLFHSREAIKKSSLK